MSAPWTPAYTLYWFDAGGEPCQGTETYVASPDDYDDSEPEVAEVLRALEPGEECRFGGGAAPIAVFRRLT